jgi:NDP-sugar pyrophosphorylase family protein
MGSRFGGAKQLEPITNEGETILDFSLFDAVEAGFKKIVFVVRSEILPMMRDSFAQKLEDRVDVKFVCQDEALIESGYTGNRKKPFGTGHAVLSAKGATDGDFCMINADDFYGKDAFRSMNNWFESDDDADFAMIGYSLEKTLSDFGSVSRGQCFVSDDEYLAAVIERKGILSENGTISCDDDELMDGPLEPETVVSMNLWGFSPLIFEFLEERFERFLEDNASDDDAEFYINDVVNDAVSKGKATVRVLRSDEEWIGITYRDDKERAAERLRALKECGVYPAKLW